MNKLYDNDISEERLLIRLREVNSTISFNNNALKPYIVELISGIVGAFITYLFNMNDFLIALKYIVMSLALIGSISFLKNMFKCKSEHVDFWFRKYELHIIQDKLKHDYNLDLFSDEN